MLEFKKKIIVLILFLVGLSYSSDLFINHEEEYYDMSWQVDGWLLPLSLSVYVLGQFRYADMEAVKVNEFSKDDLLPWDKPFAGTYNQAAANWSDYLYGFALIPLGMSFYDWRKGDLNGREYSTEWLMLLEAISLQAGLNLMTRSLRFWPRPFIYGSSGKKEERESGQVSGSFYSGHSSTAFTLASFFSTTYYQRNPNNSNRYWFYASSYGIATVIAALRVGAGKHFPTDVVVGAVVGGTIGWAVPQLHKNKKKSKNSSLMATPMGLLWCYSF